MDPPGVGSKRSSKATTSPRWDRLGLLFEEASALPQSERKSWLERACGDDPSLCSEVLSLLRHSDADNTFLCSGSGARSSEIRDATGRSVVDALVGRQIQNYRIDERVGSGGMGVVYRALDTRLDRPVALKFIWPASSTDPTAKERFLVEARAAAALDHPNICTVHEIGETPDGALFIAMAYYAGETLKEKVSRGPLSIEEAVDAVLQTAEGVKAAHARGIVHRDIKPGNILITSDGTAKLLDFGIASNGDASLTAPDGAVGTTAYMSPEQFRGEAADNRSDVRSLGVVLYELLAGRRPFDGGTPERTLYAVLYYEPPPITETRPDSVGALEPVIRRALARNPADRQQSVEELIAEIRLATGREPAPVVGHRKTDPQVRGRHPGLSPSRPAVLVGAAVIVIMVASFLWRQASEAATDVEALTLVTGSAPSAVPPVATDNDAARSVAVLAFEDLSPEADQAWFADGIAEEILGELTRIDGLRVTVHTSSFTFRGPAIDVQEVGARLGVAYLVAGSIRRGGDSIWVMPKLVDTRTGSAVWSETYARLLTAENLRDVQRDVASHVARTLALRLRSVPEPQQAGPGDAAYEAYLEGRYHLRRFQSGASRDRQELLRSVGFFQEVVQHSPSWAPGWAALGEAHHWAAYRGIDAVTHYPESRRALERALELDPEHAPAHASLGYLLHRWERDFDGAEAQFRRALDLDADQYWFCGYAYFLLWAGRYEEAIDAARRQEARDPLFIGLKFHLGSSYRCAGRLQAAIDYTSAILASHPSFIPARRDLVLALAESGREEEAVAQLEDAPEPVPYLDLLRALLLARAGRSGEAEELITGIDHESLAGWAVAIFPSRIVSPAALHAAVLVAIGQPEIAIGVLQEAVARDPGTLLYDRCYRELASLEADPRYQELLRRAGLPHSARRSGAAVTT